MSEQSLVKQLIERRVPQIAGLYIAATWMMIEMGDWMTERFNTPDTITSYIFIGMLCFIPSVLILAYQYGKPGKDPLKKTTFIFVPSNLAIAILAMFYLVSPVAATETKIIIDEKGNTKTYEVSKQEFRSQLVSFFWKNKSQQPELDWMRYGLAWLLSRDIDRSLFVSSFTPFASNTILSGLQKAGYDNATNEPKSLQLELARKRFLKFMLEGQFDYNNDFYTLEVNVYEVASGKLYATHSASGKELFSLIDDLTVNIKKSIGVPIDINEQTTDLPVKEHTSESLPAIKDLIEAKIARDLNNDYVQSKALLEQAVAKDFSFTNVYTHLARTNQLMGNAEEASQALSKALKHEYKLTTEEKFLYRGMVYGLRGDYQSQVKVYDMWLELFPDDIDAHKTMSRLLLVTGIDLDKALVSLKQLRLLSPSDDSVIRNMTNLYVLKGELERAIETQQEYTRLNPQDNNGLLELASIYERTSQFELAKQTYNRVLLLEMDNLTAAIRLAQLDLKIGNFEAAENKLANLLANATTDKQQFEILQSYVFYYTTTGQITKVLETITRMKQHAQHLPPIMRIFSLDFSESLFQANLGRFEQSLESLEKVKQQLQPPLDSIIEMGAVSAHILAKDLPSAKKSLAKLTEYIKTYPNPMLSSAIDSSQALIFELEGNYEQAVGLHQKALDAISGNIVNTQNESSILGQQVLLANAKRETGNLSEAKADLLKVIALFPSLPHAHFRLAQCYLQEGNMDGFRSSIANAEKSWANADKDFIEYRKMLRVKALANSN